MPTECKLFPGRRIPHLDLGVLGCRRDALAIRTERGTKGHHLRRLAPKKPGRCREGKTHSEIRVVRTRDGGVLSAAVFMGIFSADVFRPLGRAAQIGPRSYRRRPSFQHTPCSKRL
jgi:hypothetical protein